MATAISGLGALTIPATDDLVEIVDVSDISMSANGTNKKITFENLLSNWDGWQPANETWTYASASTFTVAGDVTAKYKAGTRIKFTQTTVKYGVVVSSSYSSPNTTVTIAVNTDYTIANATIYAPYLSYSNPPDYPHWFNYTPTITGSTTSPSLGNANFIARFSLIGKICSVNCHIVFGSTSSFGNGTWYLNLPITPEGSGSNNHRQYNNNMWAYVAATSKTHFTNGVIIGNSATKGVAGYKYETLTQWGHNQPGAWASGDEIGFGATYEID